MLIQSIRISVGDLQPSEYEWASEKNGEKTPIVSYFTIAIIWFLWILNIYLILIVLLNLLIA
jgi:hypothetical protein